MSPNQNQDKMYSHQVQQNGLARKIKAHWEEFRPKMCKSLEEDHQLNKSVMSAALATAQIMLDLKQQGLSYDKASEIANAEYYLLPSEQDQPTLNFDPATLPEPDLAQITD